MSDWTVDYPVLAACLVGDGTLTRNPRNPGSAQLVLSHCPKDRGWLEAKADLLREELGLDSDKLRIRDYRYERKDGKTQEFAVAALCSPAFLPIWQEVYDHGRLTTQGRRFKQLLDWPTRNPDNLLQLFWTWYLDDGRINPIGRMELDCYQSKAELTAFVEALKTMFDKRHGFEINPKVNEHSSENASIPGNDSWLQFSTYETSKILEVLQRHMPDVPCMSRKLAQPETPTGRRWITKAQLALQAKPKLTAAEVAAVHQMTVLELQAYAMRVNVGHPRTVNGRQLRSKAAYIDHILANVQIMDTA